MNPSHGHDFTIVNGISRIGYMTGGKAARWVDEDIADTITGKAVSFIEKSKSGPFFLYFCTHDIHVPRVPHRRFVDKTPMGPRGDVIAELDWTAGQILDALDRNGLAQNTVVIFTSDNGPVVDDGYQAQAVSRLGGHKPGGPYRGGKYSKFEAGTRIPFLIRWPRQIRPGVSDALISQTDLAASFASLPGYKGESLSALDSVDLLPALMGTSRSGRQELVEQANGLALRVGNWKYIAPSQGQAVNPNVGVETGNSPDPQLYDLAADPGERNNLAAQHPDRVRDMAAKLAQIRKCSKC